MRSISIKRQNDFDIRDLELSHSEVSLFYKLHGADDWHFMKSSPMSDSRKS